MRVKLGVHLSIAVMLTIAGLVLLFSSFWVEPTGIIDSSVLVAYGEVSTFAGGLLGVSYHYRYKVHQITKTEEDDEDESKDN